MVIYIFLQCTFCCKIQKIQKITFFQQKNWKFWRNKISSQKKYYYLSFANWGDYCSTRALQSTLFHHSGWVAWAWRSSSSRSSRSSRTVLPLSNIGCFQQHNKGSQSEGMFPFFLSDNIVGGISETLIKKITV